MPNVNADHTTCSKLKLRIAQTLCLFSLFWVCGCSMIISSATSDMMAHLSSAISNNDDLEMVQDGAPAYLLMIDSLIAKDPENSRMLSTAANLYASYADLFVTDAQRSRKMADKALDYAQRAVCATRESACAIRQKPFKEAEIIIGQMTPDDIPALFSLGNAWAKWILANKKDFNAIADIAHIELIMNRIVEMDDTYKEGAAYLYLGTLASLLPPALGGRPEEGKVHFEKALAASKGKNLMVHLLYAKFYSRAVYDRTLHDRLIKEIITSDPRSPGYTLINTWAQKQARILAQSADDYF